MQNQDTEEIGDKQMKPLAQLEKGEPKPKTIGYFLHFGILAQSSTSHGTALQTQCNFQLGTELQTEQT